MGLPKYIVNYDDLTGPLRKELVRLINDAIKEQYPQINTHDIEAVLKEISRILPSNHYEDVKRKINSFIYKKIVGIQNVEGKLLDVPPIIQNNKIEFKFNSDVYVTGLHFDQTGWKKEDTYSLEINKTRIINNANIKEIGEHKYFNTYYPVIREVPISFILHNNSGNSRQLLIDLEYLVGEIPIGEIPIDQDPPANPVNAGADIPVVIPQNRINRIGYIDILTEDIDVLIIEGNFSNITGAKWPDLNLIYRDGETANLTFGYNSMYCNAENIIVQNDLPVCTMIEYTGWGAPIEKYIITKPKKGRWYIEGRGLGSMANSEVTVKVNMDWKLTNIQV